MQKHLGLRAALATAIACLAISGAPAGAADGGPAVKLRAELGRDTVLKGAKDRVYLRVDLAGLVHSKPTARPPVNVAIVLDRSGSMKGRKLAQAKQAAINAVRRLAPHDVVSLVIYNHDVRVIVPAMRLSERADIEDRIRRFRAEGRTALYAGVKSGIEQLAEYLDRNHVNRVILLSDGLANVGPRSPREIGALGQSAAEQGISITTIGLGLGYNEDLMAKLAFASDGNHAFVEHPSDLVEIFDQEFGDVLSVVAQDVEVTITCHVGIRPIRVLGRNAKVSGRSVAVRLNQLYARQEKYLILEFEVTGERGLGAAPAADIRLSYRDMASKQRVSAEDAVELRVSTSKTEAEASLNKRVMTGVVQQIATEKNEEAVALRDAGKVDKARRVLQQNSTYLKQEAGRLGSSALRKLGEDNQRDAKNLAPEQWSKSRKLMRARQHKDKTQQKF